MEKNLKISLLKKLINLHIPFGRFSEENLKWKLHKLQLGYLAHDAVFDKPKYYGWAHKIFLYENTRLAAGAKFIQSDKTDGRFIVMKNSEIAQDVTIVTNSHNTHPIIGQDHRIQAKNHEGDIDKDIVVEEDVWIGINVTLMPGVRIGRGAIVGTGSLVTKDVPPYSICVGFPAKFLKFKYTIDEILEHEQKLYSPEERMSKQKLMELFAKYTKNGK